MNDRGILSLGDFRPSDEWQTHVNSIFYGMLGSGIHAHFQTYVSRDYRLAHSLAEEFFEEFRGFDGKTCFIHEWGVGNGNLAACFLSHLKSIDREGRVYRRVHYVLCDYSSEILNAALLHPQLREHAGHFAAIRVDAENLACFKPGSVHKIISNEIWDDLATKVLLKDGDSLYEEYLLPSLDPRHVPIDFEEFKQLFAGKNLSRLAQLPPFLDKIVWERSWQRVDISDWPHAEVLEKHVGLLMDRIPVPINTGAFATLRKARELLHENAPGYSGMDYGMFSLDDLNRPGRPYFNLYGGQYTFMVNFPLLTEVGKAVGFQSVRLERQHDFVGRRLGEKTASVVEIMQSHSGVARMDIWDRDILMLETIQALNGACKSPYKRKMEYPPMPGAPKKQRKKIQELAQNLAHAGIPDTVAYVTQGEVVAVLKQLQKLGYREKDLSKPFHDTSQPINFVYASFCR